MKKNLKKIAALLLALSMVCSLSGCYYTMSRDLTEEEKNAIEAGTVTDGAYENAVFSLGYTLPRGWTMTSQEEIWQTNKWDEDKNLKEQVLASMSKPGYFYEMMAEREDKLAGVNVCIENASVMEQPDITEDMYVASAVLNAQEHFKEAGCQNVKITKDQERFAGGEHYYYHVSCKTPDGQDLYYKAMYIKEGIYVAVITASSTGEDLTGEILTQFYGI